MKLLEFKLKRNLGQDLFGLYKSIYHWEWLEFSEHREYTFWDPLKHIDWKASSKSQKLFIKKYEENKHLKVLFLVDINQSFFQLKEKLQLLKEVLHLLSLTALTNNDQVFINHQPLTQIKWLFYFLENLTKLQKINLENEIHTIASNPWFKNYLIFVLSDTDNIQNLSAWKLAGLKNEINFINIFHKFENNLKHSDSDILLHNKYLAEISLQDTKKILQYKTLRQQKLQKFKSQLARLQIDYLYLDTSLNPYKEIFRFFQQKTKK